MPTGKKTVNNGVKCTKAEKERRIEEGSLWLIENPDAGWSDFDRTFTAAWGLQSDRVNYYRKECLKRVGKSSSEDIDTAKRLAQASLTQMIKKAMDAGDLKLAFEMRKELNKVTGAHAPVRTEVVQKEDRDIFKIDLGDTKLKKVD